MIASRLFKFSLAVRFSIILLQVIFNLCVPDHDADAFRLPYVKEPGVGNVIASYLLSGFSRWDAQYFLHISLYGYTHENTLAFFPLFPILLRGISGLMSSAFSSFLCDLYCTLIAGVLLNCILFSLSTVFLYKLTHTLFHSEIFACTAALLFSINPASIFFSALYSESLFSFFTFSGLWALEKCKFWYALVALSLSAAVRSNGILSAGYLVYFLLKIYIKCNYNAHPASRLIHLMKAFFKLLFYLTIFVFPFVAYQAYCYALYCTSSLPDYEVPEIVIDFVTRNDFKLPSEPSKWCFWNIPLPYSYVQSRYWNVGFLRYFSSEQIPNFLLAFPIFTVMFCSCVKYFHKNRNTIWHLGLLSHQFDDLSDIYSCSRCFPYFCHVFVLVVFCALFIHIQVMTRILCSSSPLLYWIAANCVLPANDRARFKLFKEYSHKSWLADNMHFMKRVFLKASLYGKSIFCYFFSYLLIGTFLHVNFFPWT